MAKEYAQIRNFVIPKLMVHILMTNAQHCNKTMEIMKKEKTGKRKENSNTLRKYVYTRRVQNQNSTES